MISTGLLFLIIIGLVVVWGITAYNSLIKLDNRTDEAWSDIEVQLKRRYNLIPNLVETVEGYATHEKDVFRKVSEARSKAMGAEGVQEKQEAENTLSRTLKSLFAVSESYPELKASQNFLELQRELRDTEDKILAARRFYNANVRDLNTKIESFPSNLVASSFGFKQREMFELEETAAKEAPKVEF